MCKHPFRYSDNILVCRPVPLLLTPATLSLRRDFTLSRNYKIIYTHTSVYTRGYTDYHAEQFYIYNIYTRESQLKTLKINTQFYYNI